MNKHDFHGIENITKSVFSLESLIELVITVFRSTWMTTKINGVATDLFYKGVISHPVGMVFN